MTGRRCRTNEVLRALRQPVVALCAVLLLSNLLIPAATLAPGQAVAGAFCLPGGPLAPDDGGSGGLHPFATCCVSATMALLPAALAAPSSCGAAATGPLAAPADTVRAARRAGALRIRAPPFS